MPMHRRGSPWRWPAAVGVAVGVLLAGVFLVPRAWLDYFLTPLDLDRAVRPTPADSARVLFDAVGLPVDLAMVARPDSALAVRLLLLQRHDGLRFDALKPYLLAMGRAASYRDLQSRVADMYDDFLRQEVIVTE